jgi:hypothetical protein
MMSQRRGRTVLHRSVVEMFEQRQLLSGAVPMNFEDGLFGEPSSGLEAQVGSRWTTTATNGSTGTAGNPITLTWGFVADGVNMPNGGVTGEAAAPSNLQATLNAFYGPNTVWQPIFATIFDRWSQLAGVTYTFTGYSDDGAAMPQSGVTNGAAGLLGTRPDVRIGGKTLDGVNSVLAYNYFPNAGDMTVDTSDYNAGGFFRNTANSNRPLRNVLGHEHGHGLGFNHVDPINQTKLMEASTVANPIFDGPQFDDIYAAQFNYGDPYEKGGRNETFGTASSLGALANQTNGAVSAWVNANNPTTPRSIANTTDVDFLSFSVTGTKNVSFTLAPFGPTYTQGPQGGATGSFNASSQGDLTFQLIGTNGTTVIQSVNATGLGGSETVTASNLTAGTYFLRVGIASGTTQPYNINATISDVVVAPPAPSTPVLTAASDSGISNSDRITNINTPTFTGTAQAGSTVNILFNGVSVGSGVATGGNYSISTSARPDGTYSVTATATASSLTGPASAATTVTIDTVAPTAPINNRVLAADDTGQSSSDNITKIQTPRFNGTAEIGSAIALRIGVTTVASGTTAVDGTYTSTATPVLADGSYTLTVTATDVAGNVSPTGSAAVVVDTQAPVVTSATLNRATAQTVTAFYSEALGSGIGALTLNNTTRGTSFATNASFAGATADAYAVVGNVLTDGRYEAIWSPNTVADIAGNAGVATNPILVFRFLRADFNNNATVNFDDLLILAANYNTTPGTPRNDLGDANYDGTINFDDLLILASVYNTSLPGVPDALTAPGTPPVLTGPDSPSTPLVRPGNAAGVLPPTDDRNDGDDASSDVLA